jgi:hypothetical protein
MPVIKKFWKAKKTVKKEQMKIQFKHILHLLQEKNKLTPI